MIKVGQIYKYRNFDIRIVGFVTSKIVTVNRYGNQIDASILRLEVSYLEDLIRRGQLKLVLNYDSVCKNKVIK